MRKKHKTNHRENFVLKKEKIFLLQNIQESEYLIKQALDKKYFLECIKKDVFLKQKNTIHAFRERNKILMLQLNKVLLDIDTLNYEIQYLLNSSYIDKKGVRK